MKLVAAKCPSCGAQIDVDEDSDSTKCEYCKSKIIVDDAIEKYKVEISGKVEVDNLPNLENYLKLGERYYKDREYTEAYKQYEKACELDPDNYISVLRNGLAKAYSYDYDTFDLKPAINAMKNAYGILKEKNEDAITINESINECYMLISTKEKQIINYYKNNKLDLDDTNLSVSRMRMCIGELQYLKEIIENDTALTIRILNTIIECLDFLLEKKYYVSGINKEGNINRIEYKLSDYSSIKSLRQEMIEERNSLDPEEAKKYIEEKKKEEQQKNRNNIIAISIIGFLIFLMLISFLNSTPSYYGEWHSDEMTIIFEEGDKATIKIANEEMKEYSYLHKCNSDANSCNIDIYDGETIIYKFKVTEEETETSNSTRLCLLDGEQCKLYFTK